MVASNTLFSVPAPMEGVGYTFTRPGHGFTPPLPLPVHADAVGAVVIAHSGVANDVAVSHIAAINGDDLTLTGEFRTFTAHGFTIGEYYYLQDTGTSPVSTLIPALHANGLLFNPADADVSLTQTGPPSAIANTAASGVGVFDMRYTWRGGGGTFLDFQARNGPGGTITNATYPGGRPFAAVGVPLGLRFTVTTVNPPAVTVTVAPAVPPQPAIPAIYGLNPGTFDQPAFYVWSADVLQILDARALP